MSNVEGFNGGPRGFLRPVGDEEVLRLAAEREFLPHYHETIENAALEELDDVLSIDQDLILRWDLLPEITDVSGETVVPNARVAHYPQSRVHAIELDLRWYQHIRKLAAVRSPAHDVFHGVYVRSSLLMMLLAESAGQLGHGQDQWYKNVNLGLRRQVQLAHKSENPDIELSKIAYELAFNATIDSYNTEQQADVEDALLRMNEAMQIAIKHEGISAEDWPMAQAMAEYGQYEGRLDLYRWGGILTGGKPAVDL